MGQRDDQTADRSCPLGRRRALVLSRVLLKRRLLIESGWPREALLVTVVRDKKGKGHAVLTVTTDKGDYVLDNQKDELLLWSKTGYRFIKRQSQSNPNVWVSLGDPRPAIATATSR